MSESSALAVPPQQTRVLSVWNAPTTQEKIRTLVPQSMSFDRFNRLTVSLIHRNPKIAECDPVSFMACVSDCATIGVYPDPVTGLAYIIPRFNGRKQCTEATLLVGYKGLRSIALRSPDILDLWTGIVRKDDVITLRRAPRQELVHEESPTHGGEIIGYYSVAALRNGLTSYEYMAASEVAKVKQQALAKIKEEWKKNDSPWTAWEDEMGRKTVLRRHFKSLPLRPEDQELVEREITREETEEPLNVTPGPEGETQCDRPKVTRRGGAAAAKASAAPREPEEQSQGQANGVADSSAPDTTPASSEPAADAPAKRAEVEVVADDKKADEPKANPKASKQEAKAEPKHEEKTPDPKAAETQQAPDIAPGVSFAGYHGKAWPVVLTVKITAIEPAVTPQKRPLVKLTIEHEGYKGDVLTFEGVALKDGVPTITKSFLQPGAFIEANFSARLRPSKERDEHGNPKPDFTRAPALFAENVSAASVQDDF